MFSHDAIQLLKQKSDILKYDCICNSQSSLGKQIVKKQANLKINKIKNTGMNMQQHVVNIKSI